MPSARLAVRIVNWQRLHGRNSLPWQNTRDPYRVWLSEIMLQQTQVSTVIDYYQRFLDRFPTVADLACAEMDEVLSLWAGLGLLRPSAQSARLRPGSGAGLAWRIPKLCG